MGIIRANQLPKTAQAFSMNDVEDVAKRVLLKAKLQAERLIESAMIEAEALKEEAKKEGSREGFEHGHAEGARHGTEAGKQQALKQHTAELSALAKTLSTIISEVDSQRKALEQDALSEVAQLALAIARRVTKRQCLVDPGVLEANLRDAMKLTVGAQDLRIAVHPSQSVSLRALLPQLKVAWPKLKHVELVDDPALSPGGCRLFTRTGSIDADVDAQLERVINELMPDAQTEAAA